MTPYSPSSPPAPSAQPHVATGVLLALLALPAALVVYALMAQVGFIVSFAAFGVAWLAARLYRLGSGAPLDRSGVLWVVVVTAVSVVAAVLFGVVWQFATLYASTAGGSPLDALGDPQFWEVMAREVETSAVAAAIAPRILLSLAFAAYGCFSILRRMWRQAVLQQAGTSAGPMAPPQ